MTDERNFRSTYYEKVGFRSVEEKRSLEILLKDKPLDQGKLKQFCLRFSVPTIYRNLVWKLLLGVVPRQVECHPFIMSQRKQECEDLVHALHVMRIVDKTTPKAQLFYAMWLLHTGNLRFDVNFQAENAFVAMVQSFQQFFEDDTDVYWLTKCLYSYTQKFKADITKLEEVTFSLLEREDEVLYKHFQRTGILSGLPLKRWFENCFAGLLNESALGKIWDKLCGGSSKILVFVVVVLLTNQKHKLLKCNDIDNVMLYVKNLPEEIAEVIANKAIEMWQLHGSPLTVHDKPKPQ